MKLNWILGSLLSVFLVASLGRTADAEPLSLVVMDPLAAPLSCPCVEGYAQRKYEVLAKHLQESLGCDVELRFSETLGAALKKTGGRADIVIGKQSVVNADLKQEGLQGTAVMRLTDQKGATSQFGMIVVNREDPAKQVSDLVNYTIIFGPAEAEEKSSAAMAMLTSAGIKIPKQRRQVDEACSDGACKVIDLGPESKTAAVISSYAQPLLEGCGTIKKGDLRVVAKTAPVPFVTVFLNQDLGSEKQKAIQRSLGEVATAPDVLEALESLIGFIPVEDESKATAPKRQKKTTLKLTPQR